MKVSRDVRFWFFALGAVLALVVSAPATYAIVSPFHSSSGTDWNGIALSVALVLLLEAGAVGAKVARINLLCWLLLLLTTFANYAAGADFFYAAALPATLAAWRAAGAGWLMCIAYAGTVPVLLYTFLHFALARWQELATGGETTLITEVRRLARDVRALGDAQSLPQLAPRVAAFPEPVPAGETAAQASTETKTAYVCPTCGHTLTQGQYGAAKRHKHCRYCK